MWLVITRKNIQIAFLGNSMSKLTSLALSTLASNTESYICPKVLCILGLSEINLILFCLVKHCSPGLGCPTIRIRYCQPRGTPPTPHGLAWLPNPTRITLKYCLDVSIRRDAANSTWAGLTSQPHYDKILPILRDPVNSPWVGLVSQPH